MPSAFTGGSMVRILCSFYGAHNRSSESLYALFYDSRRNVKLALDLNACGVAVGHNHPSGIVSPSSDDLLFTHKLSQALALFNIDLLNHVVIGRDPHNFFEIPV